MHMNLDSAVFYTNDIERAVQFYRDILGFTIEYQQGEKYVSFIFPNNARLGIKKKVEERRDARSANCLYFSRKRYRKSVRELEEEKPAHIQRACCSRLG